MTYEEIMQEITSGLTGDWEKDIANLMDYSEEYKSHPQSKEILRGIGRLISQILPSDTQAEFTQIFSNDQQYVETVLSEVTNKIKEQDIDEAEELLLKILPEEELYQSDSVSLYCTFRNPLEIAYYKAIYNPPKEIRIAPYPYNQIYQLYAYVLIEKCLFDEASNIIDKALLRNPLNADIKFEKAEIYKMQGDMERFLQITIEAQPMVYRIKDTSRYWRNIGYYFIEKEKWDGAISAYLISLHQDPSPLAQSQLFYISQRTGKKIKSQKYEKLLALLEKENIPTCPDPNWLAIALKNAAVAFADRDYDNAGFYYSVVYELTQDDVYGDKVRECESLMEKKE